MIIRRSTYGISHINEKLFEEFGLEVRDEKLGENGYRGIGGVIDRIICNCCSKCMARYGEVIYFPESAVEYHNLIECLRISGERHEVYQLHDGRKIVFFDNILKYFQ